MRATVDANRRRRSLTGAWAAVSVVVVVLGVLVLVGVTRGASPDREASDASARVTSLVTDVPPSVFDDVGAGPRIKNSKTGKLELGIARPISIRGAPPLVAGGMPRILYVGAEFCPYCAAERWALVAALSRFGAFSRLGETASSSHDAYPSTPTLSFHGARFHSAYVALSAYESADRNGNPLDKVSPADQATLDKYDAPPYVSGTGTIPFVDFGGRYLIDGSSYFPSVLAGMSHLDVARAMHDPSSQVAQWVDGTANLISAMTCSIDGQRPRGVCSSGSVASANQLLAAR